MRALILIIFVAFSGIVAAESQTVFSNEPGAWEKDAANWKPFYIERIQDTVSRVVGGTSTKRSQFVVINSESEWHEALREYPYFVNAKLLGIFDKNSISVFCTKSCTANEPDRTYYGLSGLHCIKDCNSSRKIAIKQYFSENRMNFKPDPRRFESAEKDTLREREMKNIRGEERIIKM
jgi:hypothetical protein